MEKVMVSGGEHLLRALSKTEGIVSQYVLAFLEASDPTEFIDHWFRTRATVYLDDPDMSLDVSCDTDTIEVAFQNWKSKRVRFVSIQPNYFRGFRKQEKPINLQGNLVVLDGRNSSGKTSLAEAIEWVLTGHIVRRELGDPKELAECITNRFKPENEETWVELVLEQEGQPRTLRRMLIKDYDSKKSSSCETTVTLDNQELAAEDESQVLEILFAGVLPLLMQHTLRQFVLDTPQKRRDYFEQLLNLDRITYLIEKSVVSDSRLVDFPNKSGSTMLAEWNGLKEAISGNHSVSFRRVERANSSEIRQALLNALHAIAINEFEIENHTSFDNIVEAIQQLQRAVRQQNFPLLEKLRPRRTLDDALSIQLSAEPYASLVRDLAEAQSKYQAALLSAQTISEAQIAISGSLQKLRDVGVIIDANNQVCPLCDYQDIPTLSTERITAIEAWDPIRNAVTNTKRTYQSLIEKLSRTIKGLQELRYDLIPQTIPDEDWIGTDRFQDNSKLIALRSELDEANVDLEKFDALGSSLLEALKAYDQNVDLQNSLQTFFSHLFEVTQHAQLYSAKFRDFEGYISAISSQDQLYTARELWLSIAEKSEVLLLDLQWENAKKKSQQELSSIREELISARQEYLESRRLDFSEGISTIWDKLRSDRYSSFAKLFIPKPKGRGFPVKIEVKALLDNNSETIEVDALGVFSESQINAVGIAAFVTRSKLMGHTCLVFDDPVQSMDEEHFKTFAGEVLTYLCDEGFQVIVLTHSDLFASEISYAHADRPTYVTMSIEHSRRSGCRITQGNRRFIERLNRAQAYADDGNLRQAWIFVRLAIERLYTSIQIKHGPNNFKPSSWANHTAEAMWNEGVGDIVKKFAPDSAKRLHEILGMTATGAHDKAPEGYTNLVNAISDLRPLLNKLKVGG
jgi:DNA repair exonuclease SbcCD ATPase subunit